MDGPTSRLPSSVTNPDITLAHTVTARRSLREPYHSAPITPNACIDPPRPPKAGHEWVWFPGGYWAEREVVETPSREFVKAFKWRKRSGKRSSSRETTIYHMQDSQERSPKDSYEHQPYRMPLPTPYLSEEAHVQSLQRPSMPRHGNSSDSMYSPWLNKASKQPLISPYLTEEAHVQSLQRPPTLYQNGNSNDAGSPMLKPTRMLPSSPLTHSKHSSDPATPMADSIDEPFESRTSERTTPISDGQLKPKRSLINRLLSTEINPLKLKKPNSIGSRISIDSYLTKEKVVSLPPPPPSPSPPPLPLAPAPTLLPNTPIEGRGRGRGHRHTHKVTLSMRLFGKAPWKRKVSSGSEPSTSSSVRDMFRKKPRAASQGLDEGSCFEPCNSWSSQYPGGEATRVQTPPLRQSGPNQRARSFFFDISHPPSLSDLDPAPPPSTHTVPSDGGNEPPARPIHQAGHQHRKPSSSAKSKSPTASVSVSASASTTTLDPKTKPPAKPIHQAVHQHRKPSSSGKSKSSTASVSVSGSASTSTLDPKAKPLDPKAKPNRHRASSGKEWWELPASPRASRDQLRFASYATAPSGFQFDVPEHLPSSPMCPANKRHRSGGNGVCVYHGRRKRSGCSEGGSGSCGGSGSGGEMKSSLEGGGEEGAERGKCDDIEDECDVEDDDGQ
ncbi:hypothetical protein F4810DRAFT_713724 [Camillea tinctor]|nr:hypothetical protein F4810DRAFT_713724 [Camillea tinctor]